MGKSKLSRKKRAGINKHRRQSKALKPGASKRGRISISAKKKRKIVKEIRRQQREANAMDVVQQTNHKSEKENKGNTGEKMDTN